MCRASPPGEIGVHSADRTATSKTGAMSVPSGRRVRRAGIGDLDGIAQVLADAFSDYAWTRWTVDASDHRRRIEGLQRLALEHLGIPFGQVWVACTANTIEAAAIWTDSRCPPPEAAWAEIAGEQRALEGDRHEASRAAEEAVSRLQPELPHLYLGAVGTSTASQRQGLGAAVLAPTLAAADEEQIHAFLETSSDANLRFYARLGFDVVDEVRIEGGPPVWAMLRPPA